MMCTLGLLRFKLLDPADSMYFSASEGRFPLALEEPPDTVLEGASSSSLSQMSNQIDLFGFGGTCRGLLPQSCSLLGLRFATRPWSCPWLGRSRQWHQGSQWRSWRTPSRLREVSPRQAWPCWQTLQSQAARLYLHLCSIRHIVHLPFLALLDGSQNIQVRSESFLGSWLQATSFIHFRPIRLCPLRLLGGESLLRVLPCGFSRVLVVEEGPLGSLSSVCFPRLRAVAAAPVAVSR